MSEQDRQTIGIVGLGLIGGSIGLALRNPVRELIGFDASPQAMETAVRRFCVDRTGSLEDVSAADVVFLAVPPGRLVEVAAQVCKHRAARTVVTDCASVKSEIVAWADENKIPDFIAGHPMAGHEKSGAEYASAWMFRNARWILMPTKQASKEALTTVEELVRTMGATPIRLGAESHDRHVALLSHLPHAIAAVLVEMAESLDHVEVGAGSWRDLTRVGGVDPGLWTQIFIENRKELTKVIGELQDSLGEIQRMLDDKDSQAIFKVLSEAQKAKAKQEKAPGSESAKIYKPGKRRF